MKSNIALIGFMGTGKSAVGMALAKKLKKDFIELDRLIEQQVGKNITEIFRKDGEIYFRAMEIEATKEVAGRKNVVIACGGGIVLNQINVERLREEAVIVLLSATPEAILKRASAEPGKRPLLQSITKPSQVRTMLDQRRPFYERAADIRIDTTDLTVAQVVDKITGALAEKNKEEE
ncbi:MAG: shikimate kinase [Chloroflexota bacterium]